MGTNRSRYCPAQGPAPPGNSYVIDPVMCTGLEFPENLPTGMTSKIAVDRSCSTVYFLYIICRMQFGL
jgi:hypothetical protein